MLNYKIGNVSLTNCQGLSIICDKSKWDKLQDEITNNLLLQESSLNIVVVDKRVSDIEELNTKLKDDNKEKTAINILILKGDEVLTGSNARNFLINIGYREDVYVIAMTEYYEYPISSTILHIYGNKLKLKEGVYADLGDILNG